MAPHNLSFVAVTLAALSSQAFAAPPDPESIQKQNTGKINIIEEVLVTARKVEAVSYTHLTLPTICSV